MVAIRAQVILHTADNIPENFVSNSWCFNMASESGAGTLLTPILKDFYDDVAGGFSSLMAQNGHEIKYSSLPGTPPNYPFDLDTFNLASNPTGSALPDEIAICLSFQGDRSAGLPQARRRGRIYLGPLDSTAATANRPNSTFMSTMASAAATLGASVAAIAPTSWWSVWSTVDQASVPVVDGWIDNAFDVQRRRGVLPTSRTTFINY